MAPAADLALAFISVGNFAQAEPIAREALATNKKIQPDHWQRFRSKPGVGWWSGLVGWSQITNALFQQ